MAAPRVLREQACSGGKKQGERMPISKRTWQSIASVVGACIVGYFLYHTVQGDRGWLAMVQLKSQVKAAEENLAKLQKEEKDLAHRVQLLRANNLDPDLLDEQARATMDYSKPNEIIVLTPPDKKKP